MIPTSFLDTNIPMYAAGLEHPHKEPSIEILNLVASRPDSFITSTEVFQELIHYYLSADRWELGQQVFNRFETTMEGRIEPIYPEDTHLAAGMAGRYPGVSARDLLHAAVMLRLRTSYTISADTKLDQIPGIHRLDPLQVSTWSYDVFPNDA